MKKIVVFLGVLVGFLPFISESHAFTFSDLLKEENKVIYCRDDECSLQEGIDVVKGGIHNIETERKASEYIQDVVKYLLTFVTLIAVLYIIYAGFRVLTSAGEEDTAKNQKKTILSVLIGIVIMWLAYPIVLWIIGVVSTQG